MSLDNLVRIGQLRAEAPDKREFFVLLRLAKNRLADAQISSLSYESRFDLAYNAAHGLALAALRASGYRTDKRYLVFQCLAHTVNMDPKHVRLFAVCHDKRNLVEYQGYFEADEALLHELLASTNVLLALVETMST